MDQNKKEFITRFYNSLQSLNYQEMQASYHPEAQFSDPVFGTLNAAEVKAMWEMLLTRSADLRVAYSNVNASEDNGGCRWDAWYTFSATGRRVHNVITSSFEFKDDKIFRQQDTFSFWRWARYALGPTGILLGWTPFLQNKIKRTARQNLDKFMEKMRAGKVV